MNKVWQKENKMGLKIDLRKGTEVVSEAFQKTSEMSKKLSDTVQEKAKDLSEKNKTTSSKIVCTPMFSASLFTIAKTRK